jgi:hypothetical protein
MEKKKEKPKLLRKVITIAVLYFAAKTVAEVLSGKHGDKIGKMRGKINEKLSAKRDGGGIPF